MPSLLLVSGELSDHFLLLSPTMSFVSYPGEGGRVNGTGWFLSMLTYGNASSSGNVTVFRVKRGRVHTDSYLFLSLCVFAVLSSVCVCEWSRGTRWCCRDFDLGPSVTADLGTRWHSGS